VLTTDGQQELVPLTPKLCSLSLELSKK